MKVRGIQERTLAERQFSEVTSQLVSAGELKKWRRAYKIKTAEAAEDKKALAKYKYDP
jgi:predicted transcriptional regulator